MILVLDADVYFVHGVGPVKYGSSGNPYFNCVLQGQKTANKAVCFSPKKHKMLSEVSESKSPVKISKITPSQGDLVINDSSNIKLLQKAQFKLDERFSSNATVSLADLHSLAPRQVLSTKGYISRVGGEINHQTRTGREVSKQEILVSNDSTSVKLILYGKDVNSLVAGKTYLLRNLRLNTYQGAVFLNTTESEPFSFEETTEFKNVLESNDVDATEVSVQCKVVGVSTVTKTYYCVGCNKKVESKSEDPEFIKCLSCNMEMTKSSCRSLMGLSIVVSEITKDEKTSLYFPNDAALQLKSIVQFDDGNISKALLKFPDTLQVTFDIITKKVSTVKKV